MRTRFLITAAILLLASFAPAQQLPTGSSQSGDSPGDYYGSQLESASCSDPSMIGTAQCSRSLTGSTLNGSGLYGSQGAGRADQTGQLTTYSDDTNRPNAQRSTTIQLPPEPLTEFQKFIASTTGQLLPIYGANLFRNVPSTFAPLDNTPVPPDYLLGPDDQIRVRVWGQVNFNANVRVDRSGDVFLPQVGAIHIAGLRFDQLQDHLHEAIGRVYRNFQLIADMGQIHSIQVYITGEARRPGVYTVSSLSTLVDALFASGGPSVQGSVRAIQLRRGDQTVTTLDLYSLLISGDKSHDAKLLSGDVIYVPPVKQQIAVIGSVRRSAIYEILPREDVASVLREAGGTDALYSGTRASIERTVEHNGRQAMEIRLDTAGLATPLQDGDILHILPLVSHHQNTVTMRGNLANPGRFAWHEGMRLSDLIPDREALLTRDYWWKRTQMGLPAPEFQPIPALANQRQPNNPVDIRRNALRLTAPQDQNQNLQTPLNNRTTNPQRPYTSSEDPYSEFDTVPLTPVPSQQGMTAQTPYGQNYPENGQNSQYNQGPAPNRGAQTALADQDTDTFESLNPPRTQRTIVRLSSPEIDWSYAVIERLDPTTLKTQLIPFDLGKLVNDHDSAQDLLLQPNDVVTVFSQNDIHVPIAEQTTMVRLEGEFAHAGTYTVLPGESLRSLVERAGGLSPNAYLFGSVFTRESTRILQQRRLDEAVHEMTLQMQRGTLALAANPASTAGDLAGISAAQNSERELISQLQQVRANGRIVFQFRPDSRGVALIPDMKLENGDTFLVPSVPSTVNVLGAVFNQNSFLYHPGSEVKGFLDLAGGPNTNADRKRMFVIRANGAVLSRTVVKGVWGNEFFHLRLYPGDTIIVPEKTIKPSALRGFLDWSQIFSQLAFGAAAINVLR